MNKRIDIQIWRGVAVLAVLAFHAYPSIFSSGYLGVDLFFVISGFVITPKIIKIFRSNDSHDMRKNAFNFYGSRAKRLAPSLIVTLIGTCVLVVVFAPVGDQLRFARQGISTLLLLGNVGAVRYSGNYFHPDVNPLLHTWSLAVEEQVYLIFPLTCYLCTGAIKKWNPTRVITLLLGVGGLLSLWVFLNPSFLQAGYIKVLGGSGSDFAFYSPFGRFWEFAVGGMVYFISSVSRFRVNVTIGRVASLVVCSITFLNWPIKSNQTATTLIIVLFGALLIGFTKLPVKLTTFNRRLSQVGDWSYSIYLVHLPVLYLMTHSNVSIFWIMRNESFRKFLGLIFAILLGKVLTNKLELPFRNNQLFIRNSRKMISGGVVATLLIFTSLSITVRNNYGLPEANLESQAGWNIQSPCTFYGMIDSVCFPDGRHGSRISILIGDSHAADLAPAFLAAMPGKFDAGIWTQPGCPFELSGLDTSQTSECIQQDTLILQWIETNRPSYVFVAQNYVGEGSVYAEERAIKAVTRFTTKVVVIAQTPVFGDGLTFGSNRSLWNYFWSGNSSSVQLKSRMAPEPKTYKMFTQWLETYRVKLLNLNSIFCDVKFCHRKFDESWLFVDNQHLSRVGAIRTVPILRSALDPSSLFISTDMT